MTPTFEEWHRQFEHPGMTPSDEMTRDDRLAGWDAGVAAERERCAWVAETLAVKNRDHCPAGCRCADGWHVAAAIRGTT